MKNQIDTFYCPYCKHKDIVVKDKDKFRCKSCSKIFDRDTKLSVKLTVDVHTYNFNSHFETRRETIFGYSRSHCLKVIKSASYPFGIRSISIVEENGEVATNFVLTPRYYKVVSDYDTENLELEISKWESQGYDKTGMLKEIEGQNGTIYIQEMILFEEKEDKATLIEL